MMSKRIAAVIAKDLLETVTNRTILAAVMLPVVASLFFALISDPGLGRTFSLGIVNHPGLVEFVSQHALTVEPTALETASEAEKMTLRGELGGYLTVSGQGEARRYTIHIDNRRPVFYYALKDQVQEVIALYEGYPWHELFEYRPISTVSLTHSMLPVWLTITVTMIGVMVVSGTFAEEKDLKTIDALQISPLRPWELLTGKAVAGVALCLTAVSLMLLLNGLHRLPWATVVGLLSVSLLGAACFTALGLLVGLLSGSQARARAVGTTLYLPLLLPALSYELSPLTQMIARMLPTYYLYYAYEQLLVFRVGVSGVRSMLVFLVLFAVALGVVTLAVFVRGSGRLFFRKGAAGLLLFFLVFLPAMPADAGEEVQAFAARVYEAYELQDFAAVYGMMHPALQEDMTLEAYETFQRENTERYQMKVLDPVVGEVRTLSALPRAFRPYIDGQADELTVYAVEVHYTYQFRFLGRQHERDVEKDVIVLRQGADDSLYLLWDPQTIRAEEPTTDHGH